MKHSESHIKLDRMLSESVKIGKFKSKKINEDVQLSLSSITDLIPYQHIKGDDIDSKVEYKKLLIDLANSLNKFYKQHNIRLQIKTK